MVSLWYPFSPCASLSHPPVRIKTQWGRLEHSAFLDSTPMVSLVPEIPMDTGWTRNFRLVRGKYHALCTLIMYLNLTCSAQNIYLHTYIYNIHMENWRTCIIYQNSLEDIQHHDASRFQSPTYLLRPAGQHGSAVPG
jgi:hypothetical protein